MSEAQIKEIKDLVEGIRKIDAEALSRQMELGELFNFQEVVEPAKRIINLYNLLYLERLATDFSFQQLNQLRHTASADFRKFEEVLNFKLRGSVGSYSQYAYEERNKIIQLIQSAYDETYRALHPLITYQIMLVLKADFAEREKKMEGLQRKIEKEVEDHREQYSNILKELQDEGNKQSQEMLDQAQKVLDKIRGTSSELGVSQQAVYFKDEADRHDKLSEEWKTKTTRISLVLLLYSVLAIFSHNWSWLNPDDVYQTVQVITGKMLVFSVLVYMLVLSSKNFLAHKHNTIVNKHRQNALLTFRSLTDAAKQEDHSDIVLLHAAQCIFSPQETGYAKQDRGGKEMLSSSIDFRRMNDGSKQD